MSKCLTICVKTIYFFQLMSVSVTLETNQSLSFCGTEYEPLREGSDTSPQTRQQRNAIIDLAIFYDQAFEDKFKTDLNRFLKTLMRQSQMIFNNPALTQASIRLVVTKLEKVNSNDVPYHWKHSKQKIDFCAWQNKKYPDGVRKYDIAAYLTTRIFACSYQLININYQLSCANSFRKRPIACHRVSLYGVCLRSSFQELFYSNDSRH